MPHRRATWSADLYLRPMGRSRRIISLVGLLLAFACAVPAAGAAAASSYSWSQPRDFPPAAGATNPSADAYGSTSWSYAESDTAQTHSAGYAAIPGTYGALSNGLSGWQDMSDADSPFIAGDVS